VDDLDNVVEWCNECSKGLKADEIYIWNGESYCVSCINIASARGDGGWRE